MGAIVVVYCIFILAKAIFLYRKEVLLSRKILESQTVTMLQQAKMSSLGEMAGGVAHEINNPLAMINGHITQLLREMETGQPISEKGIEKGKKIQDTVARISKIVSALRTFSKEAENDPFQANKMTNIVNDLLFFCSENLKINNVDIRISGNQNFDLECRPTQIAQVLVNLINNSFDAVKGLPEKWIEVNAEVKGEKARITVTDSGHGIRKDIVDKIMQPFFTTKEIGKGTGLGLSVSKGIIETHGGSLRLDRSCPNTRFVIALPLQQKPVKSDRSRQELPNSKVS